MAGSRVDFRVSDESIRAEIEQLLRTEQGLAEVQPRIGEYLQESTQRRFRTQTAPDGAAWQPLQPAYARRKKYGKGKILTLRGYLRSGIRWQATGPDTVEVGTDSEYGAIHQLGGEVQHQARQATLRFQSKAGKILFAKKAAKRATERTVTIGEHTVKIPARPYLGVSPADEAKLVKILTDWIQRRGKG